MQTNPAPGSQTEPFADELAQLARLAARRPDLRLVVGNPGGGWCFDWRSGIIRVDGGHFARETQDFSRGLVLHESAHAAITRLQDIVPLGILKDRRIFALLNAVEDCRIETWMQARFPGCRPWVQHYNNILFAPVWTADRTTAPAAQFLNGILTRWWFGTATEPLDESVRKALDNVWPAMERIIAALPGLPGAVGIKDMRYGDSPVAVCYAAQDHRFPPDTVEEAVRMAQFEMWSILHREIMPVFKGFLPPAGAQDEKLDGYFRLLLETMPARHLLPGGQIESILVGRGSGCHRSATDGPGLEPNGLQTYLESIRQQQQAIELMSDRLLRWFQARSRSRFQRGFARGIRIDLRAAMGFEAEPRHYDRLWFRRTVPTKIDPHFCLLIDRSGSMQGEKIVQSFHGAVLLSEVCQRTGIPLEIHSFNGTVQTLLHHDTRLDARVQACLGTLPESAQGGTDLPAALRAVSRSLLDSPYDERFLFVISDGETRDDQDSPGLVEAFLEDDVRVLGLGLGPETGRLGGIIPESQTEITFVDLPKVLSRLFVQCLRPA